MFLSGISRNDVFEIFSSLGSVTNNAHIHDQDQT